MEQRYCFPCGCSFPIIPEENPPADVIPLLDFDSENIREDCAATWALLGKGLTKGVFQLESNLGKSWTKKLKPENINEISALGAILRPGALKSVDADGVSMTQHYCRRKNKEEEIQSYHPAIDSILKDSYGCLIYQEGAMAIAQGVAGFNLQEADSLRKSIGKKLASEMAKCKLLFIEGAKKAGILSDEQAAEVFSWIEKSQRYGFNRSHATCYGVTGYESAYIKSHFPVQFYTAWLLNAQFKQDPMLEINELVNEAKLFDIVVEPPDLRQLSPNFQTDRKKITFGLTDIKGVGDKQVEKLFESAQGVDLSAMDWFDFLVNFSDNLTSNVATKFIQSGACRWLGDSRTKMLAEYDIWASLTKPEKAWVKKNPSAERTLLSCLGPLARPKKEGGGAANKNRISIINSQRQMLENPPTQLVDTPGYIAWLEEDLMGISLTCSKIDGCYTPTVNCTCKEYIAGRDGYLVFGVVVGNVREVKTKKGKTPGQKMAFMTLSDHTCAIQDVVCFPETWRTYQSLLTEGNTVVIQADRDEKKGSDTLILKQVFQASA